MNIEQRLKRLEIEDRGEGRIIIATWPNGDVGAALSAHGITERPDDLIININKPPGAIGWLSVEGVRQPIGECA